MENASKALIIAGAILISILLISLGIIIYNQAQGAINNNGMSEVETQQFNQKFLQYEGEKKSGAEIRSLIQAVNANNSNEENDNRQVTITSGPTTTSAVKVNHKYKVTISDAGEGGMQSGDGLVDKIEIVDQSSTGP